MVIVSHDIKEIIMINYCRDVIGSFSGVDTYKQVKNIIILTAIVKTTIVQHVYFTSSNGHCEDHALSMECLSKLCAECAEVIHIHFNVSTFAISWILPVDIQALESIQFQEWHNTINKSFSGFGVLRHDGVLARASIPATNRQDRNKVVVCLSKSSEAVIAAVLAHFALRALLRAEVKVDIIGCNCVGVVIQISKAIKTMGAEIRIDVINIKLTNSWPANQLLRIWD